MRKHHAFRFARRAGRVNQNGEVVGFERRFPLRHFARTLRARARTAFFKTIQRIVAAALEHDDRRFCQRSHALGRLRRIREDELGVRVAQNERDLIGRLRRKNRYDRAAGEKYGEVRDDPVNAICRDECDAIAGLHAGGANGTRETLYAFDHAFRRRRLPTGSGAFQQGGFARLLERTSDNRRQSFARRQRGLHRFAFAAE